MPRFRPQTLRRFRPHVELLEDRSLPSGFNPLSDIADTLPQALDLGNASLVPAVTVAETLGNGPAGAADVDWYSFRLDGAASVKLGVQARAGSNFHGLVSLYSNDPNSPDPGVALLQHRLIVQANSLLNIKLAEGTYFIAVSGAGNAWFNPFLADSGSFGSTGAYRLDLGATPLDLPGLAVLGTDIPADGAFNEAPLALHLRLNGAIDLSTSDVEILRWDNGEPVDFVQFQLVYFSEDSKELQLVFNKGLQAGTYQLFAVGGENFDFLFDPIDFTVATTEGGTSTNDTAADATDLGDLGAAGFLQHTGYIGNNPNYDNFGDPTLPAPGADLDIYHFTITGDGRYGLTADLFANRIGSPLDAGLTLFQIVDGQAVLLTGNNNTRNGAVGANHSVPLYTDSALFTSLAKGEYYVVVSTAENAIDPLLGQWLGTDTYDPAQGITPIAGSTTGFYVLNLQLTKSDGQGPQVTQVSIRPNANLNVPLGGFTIQFSKPVNVQQLAYQAYQQQSSDRWIGVFVDDQAGDCVYPRLVDYDPTTFTAHFVMLDALVPGDWKLHISGASGLTDFAGNPLKGNDPSGDFVVPFHSSFVGPENASVRTVGDSPTSASRPHDLGILFGHDLDNGIVVTRDGSQPSGSGADYFRFTVLQTCDFSFTLAGDGRNVPGRPVLVDEFGNESNLAIDPDDPGNPTYRVVLLPGVHTIAVKWDRAEVPNPVYELHISLGSQYENPTPLTQGAAPSFRLQLATNAPPSAPSGPVSVTPPPASPILPVSLNRDQAALSINAGNGAGSSSLIAGLASGPVGVVSGPAADASVATVRVILPYFEWASKEKTSLDTANERSGASAVDPMSDLWRFLFEQMLRRLDQINKPPVETPAPDEKMEMAMVVESAPAVETFCAAAPFEAAAAAPQSAWASVLLALGGLVLRDEDRQKKPHPTARRQALGT